MGNLNVWPAQAFGAGFLSSISLCVLPLVPAYLGLLSRCIPAPNIGLWR